MTRPFGAAAGLALSALIAVNSTARAEYPEHPIRLVVPYTPGGTVDILARMLGPRLTAAWGQPVVIENRPGAGGNIGADFVAKAAPDGYTLFLSTNAPLTINVAAYRNIKYDPLRDFAPVIVAGENALILVTNPTLPVNSVRGLIDLAKSKPAQLTAGTSGIGTTAHLSLAQFNRLAGIEITHVPYRGGVPSLTAAVAGEVPMTFSDIVPAMPLVREGRLKALATTGRQRAGIAPDIPTMIESGLPGFDVAVWVGLVGPTGVPQEIVRKLNREVQRALDDSDFRNKLKTMGIDPVGNTPEEFSALLREDVPRWKGIVTQAGIILE